MPGEERLTAGGLPVSSDSTDNVVVDGERVVVFEYCISFVIMTLRRTTEPIRLKRGQRGWVHGLPYSMVSLLFGWWGLPWGIIYTPLVLANNLAGGLEMTAQHRTPGTLH